MWPKGYKIILLKHPPVVVGCDVMYRLHVEGKVERARKKKSRQRESVPPPCKRNAIVRIGWTANKHAKLLDCGIREPRRLNDVTVISTLACVLF